MNTQGWIRGLISSNTEIDKFCSFILSTIEKEFQLKGEVSLVNNNYVFKIDRYLVSIKKKTQNGPRGVYQFVPIQDFSKSWTDEELYAKYGLSEEEIAFIESMIKPME